MQKSAKDTCLCRAGKYSLTNMGLNDRYTFLRHMLAALGKGILVAVALPLLATLLLDIPAGPVLALIGSGFIIEYGAAPVGLTLGLSPGIVFFVLLCTATGIFLCLYEICESIGRTSEPVKRFLEKSRRFASDSTLVGRYGIIGLIPCVILFGLFVNAPVAWLLGWGKYPALLFTTAGFALALAVTVMAGTSLLEAAVPGLVSP